MIRSVLVLALALLGLVLWEHALERGAAAERAGRSRVGRLVPAEESARWQIACIEVDDASGNRQLYLPYAGHWRCRTHEGAPADTAALTALRDALVLGEGVVQDEDPADPALYGIAAPTTLRVVLHGMKALQPPHSDPIASFDLGNPVASREACYVRRVGQAAVWLLESNPRAALDAPPVPGLPPLLEPYVIPRDWPGWKDGLARVRVLDGDTPRLVLERRVPPPDESGEPVDPRTRPPWIWVLDPGAGESIAAPVPAEAYTTFLALLPYVDVKGPRERDALGLATGAQTIVLEPTTGDPLRLLLGPLLPDGRVPLWNEGTSRVYLLTPEVAALLAPERALFENASDANPWETYLRR